MGINVLRRAILLGGGGVGKWREGKKVKKKLIKIRHWKKILAVYTEQ
jgi:hypothetical protein